MADKITIDKETLRKLIWEVNCKTEEACSAMAGWADFLYTAHFKDNHMVFLDNEGRKITEFDFGEYGIEMDDQ